MNPDRRNGPELRNDQLLTEIRNICACECTALDAAAQRMSDREKQILVDQLTRVATHLATRVGESPCPPDAPPGLGSDRIDLSAVRSAIPVAGMFIRNTLRRWLWMDVLIATERAATELTTAFITAVEAAALEYPTRMTLRLRTISAARVVVELRDSPENAPIIAAAGPLLITPALEEVSVRCGGHTTPAGRTLVWSELSRPELQRWI